nr:hypothetical protein [Mycobacterium sp. QGD 101]
MVGPQTTHADHLDVHAQEVLDALCEFDLVEQRRVWRELDQQIQVAAGTIVATND